MTTGSNEARHPSLEQAEARAATARVELRDAVSGAFGWFTPHRLKEEATIAASQQIDEAKAAIKRSVTRHPLASWSGFALLAALIAYVMRRPAIALAKTGADTLRTLRQRILRRKR